MSQNNAAGLATKQSRKSKNGTTHSSNGKSANGRREYSEYLDEDGEQLLDARKLLAVLSDVRNGNFTVRMPIGLSGPTGKIYDTLNDIISMNEKMMLQFNRAGEAIGKQGKLKQRIEFPNASGSWATGIDALNTLIADLVSPLTEMSQVIASVSKGNLSTGMTTASSGRAHKGEFSLIAKEVNGMVKQLKIFSMEVTRVAREVGSDGKLGGQAKVKGVDGVWKELTDSVNQMCSNLTGQVRNIAEVTTAVAKGDLSKKITVDVKGEIQELKNTINTMVDQLNSFSSEVTRVALEVGTEGKLGGQAQVKNTAGTWKDLTDSVNQMATNITAQVRNIAEVTTAVAKGDLSRKITVDVKGEILELKNTINTMVDQLNSFSAEVTRVAREVGSEGKLGGQAEVVGVAGTWKDLTDSVNKMASNLTLQVRNIAEVTTAVANGDLSKKITVNVKGEIQELKNTINTMVDQLRGFASEVTRVAREVGTDGKLGGQANVPGVAGTWQDLTESVNQMAGNLTAQVRNIAEVAIAVANGDMSKKITVDVRGEMLMLKETLNTMVDQLRAFASEVTRVATEVGTDGKLGGQAFVPGVAGTWKDLTDSVNQMTGNLTSQVRNIAEVTKAVARGDLSKTVTIDVKGEILDLKNTINTMLEQLNSFAFEVTRVAREVGTEGKLGGQAEVRGVGGTWKDLTDNVNMMASNLTNQVRGIAKVVTAVATGNLKLKLSIVSQGEVAQLTDTINEMTDTLALFADQVTSVAREVGVEGKLGAQATVPGTSGIWKNLTENVNQLAQNLTTQVRAISEVASAVTKGDLSRTIRVEAKGEVEGLKDTINQMIANLKETTWRNQEQGWLKSNLAKFTQMLQGQKDLKTVTQRILSELAQVVTVHYGAFYILNQEDVKQAPALQLFSSYGYKSEKNIPTRFAIGEGLVGQVAFEKERIILSNPPKDYVKISSSLGKSAPANLVILPVLFENNVKAVIELASLDMFSETHLDFLDQLTESIGIVLNTIEASTRTEELLIQSQSLAAELKTQQEELRRTNEELQEKALLLVKQKNEVEDKNKEVEEARRSLEEKAEQLALTSKYKSEFFANMSHELRTPLNSLLILTQQLYENAEGNLNEKQIRYARTIHSCGDDLIQLINDILDLSKIDSGVISTNFSTVAFNEIAGFAETTFRPISETKHLRFTVEVDPALPPNMETDSQRLNQILKNLLSNSFKFADTGEVKLSISRVIGKREWGIPTLDTAGEIVSFAISDTGIGIPLEKQSIIFEAFQQAEGSTSRKYGGTGLGLSISRGLAELLGGTIELESYPDKGSIFTLFLPIEESTSLAPQKNEAITGSHGLMSAGQFKTSENLILKRSRPMEELESEGLRPIGEANSEVDDDRSKIQLGDKMILVVEDDLRFARIIVEKAHDYGLKAIIASSYFEIFSFIGRFNPIAITLDVKLPNTSGWKLLHLLRTDVSYRHIPVHLISGDDYRVQALKKGARSFLLKPLVNETLNDLFEDIVSFHNKKIKDVLLVAGEEARPDRLMELLESEEVNISLATSEKDAIQQVKTVAPDCVILDYASSGVVSKELINHINRQKKKFSSTIAYATGEINKKDLPLLTQSCNAVFLADQFSTEQLFDEALLQLHVHPANLPGEKKKIIDELRQKEDILTGKHILIVDDDIRNLFALTAAFEKYKMNVVTAESGSEAIELVSSEKSRTDMILMDIMMPQMDGYEAIRLIRQKQKHWNLPIIAVTAKAMKGDREKCIEAGASDYITKPLKIDQLLSLMRVWFYR